MQGSQNCHDGRHDLLRMRLRAVRQPAGVALVIRSAKPAFAMPCMQAVEVHTRSMYQGVHATRVQQHIRYTHLDVAVDDWVQVACAVGVHAERNGGVGQVLFRVVLVLPVGHVGQYSTVMPYRTVHSCTEATQGVSGVDCNNATVVPARTPIARLACHDDYERSSCGMKSAPAHTRTSKTKAAAKISDTSD